jgi:hypothetical protein
MNELNNETFDQILPCPNCHNPPLRSHPACDQLAVIAEMTFPRLYGAVYEPMVPWTKSEFERFAFAPILNEANQREYREPDEIDESIKYQYCYHCTLTPKQITIVKEYFGILTIRSDSFCEYSESELKLIGSINGHWLNIVQKTYLDPTSLYRILAMECFEQNRVGPETDALRRVIKSLRECKPWRLTPEFDELCNFKLEDE